MPLPADAMMREDARQSTANLIGAASRGARSGVDLMNIAGQAASQEAAKSRMVKSPRNAFVFMVICSLKFQNVLAIRQWNKLKCSCLNGQHGIASEQQSHQGLF